MPEAWHNIYMAIIAPAIATKSKVYTVTPPWRWLKEAAARQFDVDIRKVHEWCTPKKSLYKIANMTKKIEIVRGK